MHRKLWLKSTLLLALLLLLGPTLSACDQSQSSTGSSSTTILPTKNQVSCGIDIAMHFVPEFKVSIEDDHIVVDAQPREDDGSTSWDCSGALIDIVGQVATQIASQPVMPPSPVAVVKQYVDDTFPYTFTRSLISNCANAPVSGTYSYNLPLVLVVGTLDANNQLQSPVTYVEPLPSIPASSDYILFPPTLEGDFPTTTDEQLIAKQLYTSQDFPDNYFNQQGQPSDSFPLTLPANSKVQLNLPLSISYRAGAGEVIRNGQAGQRMQWAYVYTFQRDFDPGNLTAQQMTVTSCS